MRHSKGGVARDSHPVFGLIMIEVTDESVRAEADSFPAKEHQQQIIGEDEEEHVADKEVHEKPVAREPELALHVLEAVDHDEEANPSNYVGEKHAKRVNENASVHVEDRR